jgi:hypothetical protein
MSFSAIVYAFQIRAAEPAGSPLRATFSEGQPMAILQHELVILRYSNVNSQYDSKNDFNCLADIKLTDITPTLV